MYSYTEEAAVVAISLRGRRRRHCGAAGACVWMQIWDHRSAQQPPAGGGELPPHTRGHGGYLSQREQLWSTSGVRLSTCVCRLCLLLLLPLVLCLAGLWCM